MKKLNHFIGLRAKTIDIESMLQDELLKTFSGNEDFEKALIEVKRDNEDFNYEKISKQPDEQRAIRIAKKESCSLLYAEDVVGLIVHVCKLPHATAKEIVDTHFSMY